MTKKNLSFCAAQTAYNYNIPESLKAESSLKRVLNDYRHKPHVVVTTSDCSKQNEVLLPRSFSNCALVSYSICFIFSSFTHSFLFWRRFNNKLHNNQKAFMSGSLILGWSLHNFINWAQKNLTKANCLK